MQPTAEDLIRIIGAKEVDIVVLRTRLAGEQKAKQVADAEVARLRAEVKELEKYRPQPAAG